MNFLYQYLSKQLVDSIGWTIFHSLWQGAVVFLITYFVLRLIKTKNANLRYSVAVTSLIILVTASIITFSIKYSSYQDITGNNFSATLNNTSISGIIFAEQIINSKESLTIYETIASYFNQNLPYFVFFWFLGLFVFAARFAGSVIYLNKISTAGIKELDVEWLYRSREIGKKVGIKKFVAVYESYVVKVPIAVGYLKPVILLPIGMISGMPYNQVETIIAHELAHIKRYDFLINLLQSFVENIFFYNPAIWWVSNQIREERENCCDDITIAVCSDSLTYSKALYNLVQIKNSNPQLSLAVKGKENQLIRRIKRMNGEKTKFDYSGKFAAFMLVIAFTSAIVLLASADIKTNNRDLNIAGFVNPISIGDNSSLTENFSSSVRDTTSLKKGLHTLKFTNKFDGAEKRFKAKLNDGKIEKLYVDGTEVQPKDFAKYESVINNAVDEYDNAMRDYAVSMKDYDKSMQEYRESMKAQKDNMRELREKLREMKHKMKDYNDDDSDFDFDFDSHSFNIPHFDSEKLKETMEHLKKNLKFNMAHNSIVIPHIHIPEIDIPSFEVDLKHLDELDNISCEFDKEEFKEQMKNLHKEIEHSMKEFDSQKLESEIKNALESDGFKKSMENLKENMGKLKVEMAKLKEYLSDVKEELIKDKLVENEDDLDKFYLSKTEMKVNGKVVSEDLHKKYLQIYKDHYGKDLDDEQKINF